MKTLTNKGCKSIGNIKVLFPRKGAASCPAVTREDFGNRAVIKHSGAYYSVLVKDGVGVGPLRFNVDKL